MNFLAQGSLCTCLRVFLGFIPKSRTASHKMCLAATWQDTAFKDSLHIYSPSSRASVTSRPCQHLILSEFKNFPNLMIVTLYYRVVLILISLTTNDISRLYSLLFIIC